MPFPIAITSPQQTTLETSNYWTRVFVALNTNEVVFRAQAAESLLTNPFITFLWDNADIGAYTDVWEGMVCYLSHTTDIRDAYYRGRARLAPSSTQFYIDQNASLLNDNDYVIVTRDTDLFSRVRNDTLVDGSITYQPLPPMTNDLPATIVLYDADNDGSVSYTTVQTGIVTDAAASSISSWAWDDSGNGTVTYDNAAIQNPTITFQAGYHYLLRVIYEDDQGTSNYQIVHVYAINRTLTAPVVTAAVTASVEGDVDDGWTASVTAYANVSTLIDRTHAVIFQLQHFGDDSSTPIFDTILMCGRIRSDSIQTEGNAEAGVVSQVGFAVEGITAYLRRLRIPNDIIRATASPNEWGEITEPNPYRMAVYEMWVYSTLTNLGSFGVESGQFEAWQIGGEPRGIDGGYALDVLTGLFAPIKAAPNWAPSGEIFNAITTSYRTDRSGVVTIAALTLSDILDYTVDRDSSRTTAQVIAFGGSFNATSNTFDLYSAQSPSIVYGDGGETLELTREILTANASITDAAAELSGRASNEYAYKNPKPQFKGTLFDAWSGVMIPTNYQRWAAVLPASSNTLGIAYTSSDYWYLQSVSLSVNDDGSIDVSIDMGAETEFSDAQTIAALLPINLSEMNPVLPVLPNDPAFPTDPLELYPTDTPDLDDLQPIDNDSAGQAYTPWPPDQAAETTARQGKPKCFTMNVIFKNPSNTSSSKTTVLGDDYLISVSGTSTYSTDEWQYSGDFSISDHGFAPQVGIEYGIWTPGLGWLYTDAFKVANYRRSVNIERSLTSSTITFVSFTYDLTKGTYYTNTRAISMAANTVTLLYDLFSGAAVDGTNLIASWSGSMAAVTAIEFLDNATVEVSATYSGYALIKSFIMRGTGTNPFTGGAAVPLSVDAFYTFDPLNPETAAAVLGPTEGLFLDNAKYGPIPPYNPNHVYTNLPFTGTNNVLAARMAFNDYGAKSYLPLNVTVCPK